MSDRTLQAQITAVDKASPVFVQVANGAQRMGNTIEQSAQKAGRSTEDLSKRMAALGAGLTAGAALLGQWSRSAQDAEAIQRQLEASIAATGESFDDYAEQIEAAGAAAVQMGFDDEAAMQALSALTQITGSANVALNEMGLVMDLAAAKSMSLESAAELVGKVHEGNTGILQRYGIAVEEGATAEEALAQIQAQVAGQAEAHATTYARLREELSNVTDAIGGAVGEFAPLLALLPGVSSGFTLVGSAIGALAPNLTKAAVASKALSLAMGPAGLVLAAGAAAVALYEIGKSFDAANLSGSETTKMISDLTTTIAQLGKGGASTATTQALADFIPVLERIGSTSQRSNDALEDAEDVLARLTIARQDLTAAGLGGVAATEEEIAQADRLVEAAQRRVDALNEQIVSEKAFKQLQEDIVELFTEANPLNAALVAQEFDRLTHAYEIGTISADDYLEAVHNLNEESDTFGLTLAEIAANSRAQVAATGQATVATQQSADEAKRATQRWKEYDDAVRAATQADIDKARANKELLDSMSVQANAERDQLERNTQKWNEYDAAVREHYDSRAQSTKAAAAALAELDKQQVSGGFTFEPQELQNLREYNQALKDNRSALDMVADGTSKASYQLAAFKEVQDGLIATQSVYSQQISEYDQNLDNIDKALEVVNRHKEEGLELSEDEIFILENATEAQDRLTAGVDDATIAQGKAAVEYGKNMTIGDKLNETLGGLDQTTGDLTQAINDLVLALNGVPEDVTSEVSIDGIDSALASASALGAMLAGIDGTVANATVNVGASVDPRLGGAFPGFRDGGIVPHEEARLGIVTRGLRAVTLGEAGPETVLLPAGSRVRNAAATAASGFGRGVIVNMHIGTVTGMGQFEEAIAEMTRMVRMRFAGLGM